MLKISKKGFATMQTEKQSYQKVGMSVKSWVFLRSCVVSLKKNYA